MVLDDGGEPLGSATSQRRVVSLLAALAVAGDSGLSRDKLIGLLWPEADAERARHSLTQTLYAARRALRCEDLFVVGADVRLNGARITTDVREFEAAIDVGDLERAVALYRGAFLDGVYVPGAPEFEQWSTAQRAHFEARAADALERLARRAEGEGEPRRAAEWWRRLAALRPLDSGVALRLMEALAAAGDRAGALQHARVHEALLREQLGIEPSPAVAELTRVLREPSPPAAAQTGSVAVPVEMKEVAPLAAGGAVEPADAVGGLAVAERAPLAIGAPPLGPSDRDRVTVWVPSPRIWRWRLPIALLVVAVLVGSGVLIGRGRRPAPVVAPLPVPQKVVVAPFRVAGASASLGYLRDGLVELLSARLADDSSARSVDAGAVLGAWRAAGLAAAVDVPRDTVVGLAARLGAERVVVGSVVGTPGRLVVRATVLRVPAGAVVGDATVEGPADSITAVVDRLAARLLVSQAGEDEQLTGHTTESLPALRAFLAGQAAFRRASYSAALRQYEEAVARDSAFALAALRLAVTADRVGDDAARHRGLVLAWAARDDLSERDRALLRAFAGPRYPAPSTAAEQRAAWERPVDLAPASAESWYTMAARLFYDGRTTGDSLSWLRTRVAVERTLAIDQRYAPAVWLLLQLTAQQDSGGSSVLADSAARIVLADTLDPFAPFLRWRVALARGDSAELRAARERVMRSGPANLRAVAMASQHDALPLGDAVRAIELLRGRSSRTTPAARVDQLLAAHSLAMNQGRPRDALDATVVMRAAQPASRAHLRLRVLDALYGDGDSTAARSAASELGDLAGAGAAGTGATLDAWLADACVLAQWRLARGDTAGAAQTAAALRARSSPGRLVPVGASPGACAELLDASLAVAARRRDARAVVSALDSLALTPETAGDATAYAPLLVARLHERLGDSRAALAAIRKRAYLSGWPRYLATMLREEGRLAAALRDTSGAREAYRRYLVLRESPDSALAPQAEDVQRALLRLTPARAESTKALRSPSALAHASDTNRYQRRASSRSPRSSAARPRSKA
ncbi:MAG TPA: BTAD domain-containing putative transcriptional regulator [Gemmatimonadaceae bacterium]|nr:BTAD domain-containing putative transcriptional regulator [Gemmatimonadaceae bacterium]